MRTITKVFFILCLLASSVYMPAFGSETQPVLVYTTGLFDSADGSVLYSVLLAVKPDHELTELTISSPLPEGATFVDVFWTPEAASFAGEQDGIVTWSVAEVPADTIMGPFTYRVTFDETPPPLGIVANLSWSDGETAYTPATGELVPFEDSGSITVDATGTEGLVAVGQTGVWIDVPAGALAESVTLTFERQPMPEDESLLPQVEEEIWWCNLFNLTVEPANVVPTLPITVLYPIRRTLTPGLPVSNFIKLADGDWQLAESAPQSRKLEGFFKPAHQRYLVEIVAPTGNQIMDQMQPNIVLQNMALSPGISVSLRAESMTVASDSFSQLEGLGLVDGLVNDGSW